MANWKVLTVISIGIGLSGLIAVIVLFTATGGNIPFDYGIIVDAGSSHTQVTLYHWLADKNRCTGVVEQIDTCHVEGGINSYNNTANIGDHMLDCVYKVSNKIDSERLLKSPIYLGATAGLRLLNITSPDKVDLIFTTIKEKLEARTKLQVMTIEIISGADEGLFAWVTTNYLSKKLAVDNFDSNIENSTYGMLDMGGASAQIAFSIPDSEKNISNDNVDIRLYGINHTVKTSSNLCFGVDQAMLRYLKYLILNADNTDNSIENPCQPMGDSIAISGGRFKDQICLKTVDKDINFDKVYSFIGTSDSSKCNKLVSSVLLNKTECEKSFITCFNVSTTEPPLSTHFYALSSYYYTARVLQLHEQMPVNQYEQKMNEFCKENMTTIKKIKYVDPKYADRYCFQLHYVYNTLLNVYKFDQNSWQKIHFASSIANASLGWSLGFMINATNVIPSEMPSPPVIDLFPFILIALFCSLILFFSVYFGIQWKREKKEEKKEQYEPINIH